jgi:hypothetical protein
VLLLTHYKTTTETVQWFSSPDNKNRRSVDDVRQHSATQLSLLAEHNAFNSVAFQHCFIMAIPTQQFNLFLVYLTTLPLTKTTLE